LLLPTDGFLLLVLHGALTLLNGSPGLRHRRREGQKANEINKEGEMGYQLSNGIIDVDKRGNYCPEISPMASPSSRLFNNPKASFSFSSFLS